MAEDLTPIRDIIQSIEKIKGPQYSNCVSIIFHAYQMHSVIPLAYKEQADGLLHAVIFSAEALLPIGANKQEFFDDCKALIKRIAALNGVHIP